MAADSSQITTTHSRPRLGFSSQSKWAKLQQAKGNCRICGKDRRTPEETAANVPAALKQNCRRCQDRVTAYMRRYRASKVSVNLGIQPEVILPDKEKSDEVPNQNTSSESPGS